jgi:Transcriptional activator of glycolytic enzymes
MGHALASEQDPADVSLDRVMPGVHERLRGITTSVDGLTRKLESVHEVFNESLQAGLGAMNRLASDALRESSVILGSTLIDAGATLLNSPSSRRTEQPTSPSSPSGESVQAHHDLNSNPKNLAPNDQEATATADEDPKGLYEFRFQAKYTTLASVCDHWLGIGDFADGLGGVHGRNSKFGSKWRKKATALDSTTYSRVNRIIKAIAEQAKLRGVQPEVIIEDWEPLFESSRYSLANFVDGLKRLNVIRTTKSRGRNNKKS